MKADLDILSEILSDTGWIKDDLEWVEDMTVDDIIDIITRVRDTKGETAYQALIMHLNGMKHSDIAYSLKDERVTRGFQVRNILRDVEHDIDIWCRKWVREHHPEAEQFHGSWIANHKERRKKKEN